MGDDQRVHYEELLRGARERYDAADDFTLAVEEEFAILDPATLELTDRFEALQLMSRGTAIEDHLVGELIASEVEVRTGKTERFPEAAALMGERRGQVLELAHAEGVELAAAGTHPWSRWQDQRIIDTPHYRLNDEILRYVVWRNNSFGLHVHVAVKGADRAVRVTSALRPYMPDLLALSASSPFVENVNTGLHSARTQITHACSRAAGSRTRCRAGRSSRTTSACSTGPAPSPSTRSSGGAFARTSRSRPWRCGSATRSPTSPTRRRSPR
jgi:hypothetical protein